MRTVQAAVAKAKFLELLRDVERGEVVTITKHGKTVARLVPEVDEKERHRKAVDDLIAWRKTSGIRGVTLEEMMEWRDEGRK